MERIPSNFSFMELLEGKSFDLGDNLAVKLITTLAEADQALRIYWEISVINSPWVQFMNIPAL